MSCCVILDQNLADEAASVEASSEQAAYPIENALDINRRKRVWRSAGFFEVETGGNSIVVQDTAGVDLTASVAVGEYASDALFFAAIKTAIEAVSDSTITVSRDATSNCIKITAVLGGAATVFRLRCTQMSAMADLMGFSDNSDLSGSLTYTAENLRIHSREFVRFDFGFPVTVHGVLAAADRNRALRISPSAQITLYGGDSNELLTTNLVEETVPVGSFIAGLVDTDGIGGVACRYWELEIIDRENPWGYVEIGALFIGSKLSLAQGSIQFPLEVGNFDLSNRAYSEGGQTVVGRGPQGAQYELAFAHLTAADYEAVMAIAEEKGVHTSFAVALDQQGAFSSDPLLWCKFVKFAEIPKSRLGRPNNWTVPFTLREEL